MAAKANRTAGPNIDRKNPADIRTRDVRWADTIRNTGRSQLSERDSSIRFDGWRASQPRGSEGRDTCLLHRCNHRQGRPGSGSFCVQSTDKCRRMVRRDRRRLRTGNCKRLKVSYCCRRSVNDDAIVTKKQVRKTVYRSRTGFAPKSLRVKNCTPYRTARGR